MSPHRFVLAGLAALMLLSSIAQAVERAERHKIAVLEMRPEGADASMASNLTTLVAVELTGLDVFQVITRDDIQGMLSFEAQRQVLGCDADASCLAEIGGALGVERVMTGKLGQIGTTYMVTLSLINIAAGGVVEARSTRRAESKEGLVAEVKSAVQEVTGKVLKELSGLVLPKVDRAGAEIRLDGKLVGLSPVLPIRSPAGSHELRVSKKGYIDWAKDVLIPTGQKPLEVEVVLVPSPEFVVEYEQGARRGRLFAWLGTGVALAAGAGAGYGYARALGNADVNAQAVLAAQVAKDANDGAAYDREAGLATQSLNAGEFQRNVAIGLGSMAILAAGLGAYFWLTGDDPDRFAPKQ